MKVGFLATNGYKISDEDLDKNDTIDKIKLRIFRGHSDHLPLPSNVFLGADEKKEEDEEKESGNGDDRSEMSFGDIRPTILHPFQIRLLFSGKQLPNYSTLDENGVKDGDTIVIAISPFYSTKKEIDTSDPMQIDSPPILKDAVVGSDEAYTTDELVSGDVDGVPQFTLAVNDHSSFESSIFSHLEKLTDAESYQLLSRLKSDETSTNTTTNTTTTSDDAKVVFTGKLFESEETVKMTNVQHKLASSKQGTTDNLCDTFKDKLSLQPKVTYDKYEESMPPVQVVVFTPTDEIENTKTVTVVFNRPFIPITTDLKSLTVPFSITPEIQGATWTWVDGITCKYTHPEFFPKSTKYTVKLLTDVMQNTYNEKMESKMWTFSTTTQYVIDPKFNNSVRSPQVSLRFSQNLPEDFSKSSFFDFLYNGEKRMNFKIIENPDHIDKKFKDDYLANKSSTIIFDLDFAGGRQGQSLDYGSSIDVHVLSGIRSTQGPLKTSRMTKFTFEAPKLLTAEPNNKPTAIDSNAGFVQFKTSNDFMKPIRFKNLSAEEINNYVTITPPVEIRDISTGYGTITISADFSHEKTYKVIIKDFQDNTDQTLLPTVGSFTFKPETPQVFVSDDMYSSPSINLDPLSKAVIKIKTLGLDKLKLTVYEPLNNKLYDVFSSPKKLENYKEVERAFIDIAYTPKNPTYTTVDLSRYFNASRNLIYVDFTYASISQAKPVGRLLQYSPYSIGTSAFGSTLSVWVDDLSTGEKLKKGRIYAIPNSQNSTKEISAEIDPNTSLATFTENIDINYLMINSPMQTILPFSWKTPEVNDKIEWSTFNESGYYKPGDKVNIKGFLRAVSSKSNEISIPDRSKEVSYKVKDPRNVEKAKGSVKLDEFGCFVISFALPLDTNLGNICVELAYQKSYSSHTFVLQEFKLKQFIVESRPVLIPSSHLMENDKFSVEVFAKSYTDEILSNTLVNWKVSLTSLAPMTLPTNFRFPIPPDSERFGPYEFNGRRMVSGRHKMDFVMQSLKSSYTVRIDGVIKDVTNRSESFTHSFTVYCNKLHFGIARNTKQAINIDEEFDTSLIVTDSLGKQSDKGLIEVSVQKSPWEEDLPAQTLQNINVTPSKEIPSEFKFKFNSPGHHTLKFSYIDPNDPSMTPQVHSLSLFVFGTQTEIEKQYKETTPPVKTIASKKFQSLLSKKPDLGLKIIVQSENTSVNANPFSHPTFDIGETYKLLITSSKIQSGTGYLFVHSRSKMIKTVPITLKEGSFLYEGKVQESDFPYLSFTSFVQGKVNLTVNDQPVTRVSSQFTSTPTYISLESKKLSVEILNIKKFQQPGAKAEFKVQVKDQSKKSLKNSNVTLIIVDEALTDISGHSVSKWNPLESFYSQSALSQIRNSSSIDSMCFQDPVEISQPNVVPMEVTPTAQQITIKYFSGRYIIFNVENTIAISELQKLIQERDGLPPTYQRLFYQSKPIVETETQKTLSSYNVPNGAVLNLVLRLSGGSGSGNDDKPDPVKPPTVIRVRQNFNSVACFQSAPTDESGIARFECTLPDSLTSYKVMALASTVSEFGSVESTFTSTLPVMIRESPPSFLNYNDECIFPVSIQSIVNYDLDVKFAIQSSTCQLGDIGFSGKLKPYGRLTIPCRAKAIVPNRVTNFRCAVQTIISSTGEEITDGISFKFPVHSPSSVESMTINNSLESTFFLTNHEHSSHPIKFPNWNDLDQMVGGAKIQCSMSPLSKVSTCLESLMDYEYACSEQLASKMMAIEVVRAAPVLFSEQISQPDFSKNLTKMREKLQTRYNSKECAFRYWDSQESKYYDYANLYIYWVLDKLEEMNSEFQFGVRRETHFDYATKNKSTFVNKIISNFSESTYKKEGKYYLSMLVFACLVSDSSSKTNTMAKKILTYAVKDYPKEYFGIISPILHLLKDCKEIKNFENNIKVTGSCAYFESPNNIGGFYSSSRGSALALISLMSYDPKHPLISKLASGLSKGVTDMSYYNTQDNAFTLYAIYLYQKRYVNNNEIKVNVYLNQSLLMQKDKSIMGDTKYNISIPMQVLIKNQGDLFIEKSGKGPLFYTINLNYAMKNPFYTPISDRGFTIKRTYIGYQNASDVIYPCAYEPTTVSNNNNIDNYANFSNQAIRIKAGSKVKVLIEIEVRDFSSFVVANDFLPACLEPTLNNSKSYWMDHLNNRAKGCEFFVDRFFPGKYRFSYITNAISFGTFIAPPSRIQEMYCASTFGRSQTEIIIVE